jgi:hypothetical protein
MKNLSVILILLSSYFSISQTSFFAVARPSPSTNNCNGSITIRIYSFSTYFPTEIELLNLTSGSSDFFDINGQYTIIPNLCGGKYKIIFKLDALCSYNINVTISDCISFNKATTIKEITNIRNCPNPRSDLEFGKILLNVPLGNLTYDWRGPNSFASGSKDLTKLLIPGVYKVTVSDDKNCSKVLIDSLICCENKEFKIDFIKDNINQGGLGSLNAKVTGLKGTIKYKWSGPNGFTSTDSTINNLFEGTYCVIVTNGCQEGSNCIVVSDCNKVPLLIDVGALNTCDGFYTGRVFVTTNNSHKKSYLWNFNNNTNKVIYDLSAGTYCVTVTDNFNGCKASSCVIVNNGTIRTEYDFGTDYGQCYKNLVCSDGYTKRVDIGNKIQRQVDCLHRELTCPLNNEVKIIYDKDNEDGLPRIFVDPKHPEDLCHLRQYCKDGRFFDLDVIGKVDSSNSGNNYYSGGFATFWVLGNPVIRMNPCLKFKTCNYPKGTNPVYQIFDVVTLDTSLSRYVVTTKKCGEDSCPVPFSNPPQKRKFIFYWINTYCNGVFMDSICDNTCPIGLRSNDTIFKENIKFADLKLGDFLLMTNDTNNVILPINVNLTDNLRTYVNKYKKIVGESEIKIIPKSEIMNEMKLENERLNINFGLFEDIKIFPNPIDDHLIIEINVQKTNNLLINCINLLGSTVLSRKEKLNVGFNKIEINTSNLIKGLYFFNIIDERNNQKSFKIIKTN